jgi:excinuclease ABC subunit B
MTDSMKRTIEETDRRREIQEAYNKKHGITPTGVNKDIDEGLRALIPKNAEMVRRDLNDIPKEEYGRVLKDLTAEMELAAANLQFESAAELRDLIADLKAKM